MKPIRTWILIADGTQARLLCNDGPGHGLEPVFDEVVHGRNRPGREIDSDRPGRTFDSAGAGRHAKEPPTDPRDNEKQHFVRRLATLLDDGLKHQRYDRLVIAAPPRALGQLRAVLPDRVRAKVAAELGKDLTHIATGDLARHLGSVMAV
jgi:protein required for attachment to host cells